MPSRTQCVRSGARNRKLRQVLSRAAQSLRQPAARTVAMPKVPIDDERVGSRTGILPGPTPSPTLSISRRQSRSLPALRCSIGFARVQKAASDGREQVSARHPAYCWYAQIQQQTACGRFFLPSDYGCFVWSHPSSEPNARMPTDPAIWFAPLPRQQPTLVFSKAFSQLGVAGCIA